MRTWSIESAFIKGYTTAAVAVQAVCDAAHTLNELTRPARRGTDGEDGEAVVGCLDMADCIASGCQGSCSEPTEAGEPQCECFVTDEKYWFRYGSAVEPGSQMEWNPDCPVHGTDDTLNPTEPGLDDQPLIAPTYAQLDRMDHQTAILEDIRNLLAATDTPTRSYARGGVVGHSDEIPAAVRSDGYIIPRSRFVLPPPFRFDGPESFFAKSSAQSAGCTEPTAPAEPRTAGSTGGGVVSSPPGEPAPPRSDDAVAEWIGGAVPVIAEVLAAHVPHERSPHHYVECVDPHGTHDFGVDDWPAWRAHIAPIIAEVIAAQPKWGLAGGIKQSIAAMAHERDRLLGLPGSDGLAHAITVLEKLIDHLETTLQK